jgi:hypothetical protein
MGDSVKVAVRVRPYNNRERQEGAELCVAMSGKTTKIWSKEQGIEKEFNFDYSYWSHDGFIEEPGTGLMKKASLSSNYADQQTVFNDLGIEVLNNAWNGYHVCLFAYGQTGAGKSYSIVGYGANKGIIPIACEEIFKRIRQPQPKKVEFQVEVSMLEIYNEQVQDLLVPPSGREKGGLKVRENPKTGVYVEGLKKVIVNSYQDISNWLDKGNEHRTVGATQMNATSSRAHTVLTISFTQLFYDDSTGKPLNRKQSDINLVDLAGSERAGKTGATGDRLAEGSNINKSLSCLGKVITALAKKSGGNKAEVVPYRESKLTRILQNALGGNSKTTMIAAISPATFNFEETLSTLRYADQVKSIKNQAVVNETPQEKLIRELKEENERLKALVEGRGGSVAASGVNDETLADYQSQIEMLRIAKEQAEMTFQQRLEDMEKNRSKVVVKEEVKGPHLTNLNEDPQLNGQIKHLITNDEQVIGKGGGIVINGLGVSQEHCKIVFHGGKFILTPLDPSVKTMVNGQIIKGPTEIHNQDRIRFGNHVFFSFIDPEQPQSEELNFEFAVKEANETEMKSLIGEKEAEIRRKEEEMQKKMQEEIQRAYQKMEEEKKTLEKLMNSKAKEDEASRQALAAREKELLEKQRKMEEELQQKELELREKEKERVQRGKVEQMISSALQLTNEANERASVLGKPMRFRPEFYREVNPDGTISKDSVKLRLRLQHPSIGDSRLYWNTQKLEERIPDMADMCEQYFTGTPLEKINIGYDPFSINLDELEEMMDDGGYLGMVNLIAESLWYLLGLEETDNPIYGSNGSEIGKLVASVDCSMPGEDLEEAGYENMEEIQGKELIFDFKIKQAKGLPNELCKDVYCSYTIGALGREVFKTSKSTGRDPVFNFRQQHKFIVTKYVSDQIKRGQICINLFGNKSDQLKQEELNKIRKALGAPPVMIKASAQKEEVKAHKEEPKTYKEESKGVKKIEVPKEEYKASPSPLSQSILDGSIEKNKHQNASAIVVPSTNPAQGNHLGNAGTGQGVVEKSEAEKIKELEAKLKAAEEKSQKSEKKSGCCEVF